MREETSLPLEQLASSGSAEHIRSRIRLSPRRGVSNTWTEVEQMQGIRSSQTRSLSDESDKIKRSQKTYDEDDGEHDDSSCPSGVKERKRRNSSPFELRDYSVHHKVGNGGQASVYLGIQKGTGKVVAIKVKSPKTESKKASETKSSKGSRKNSEIDTELVEKEAALMKRLKHENIIQMIDVVHTKKGVALVMEFAEKGDLAKYIEKKGKLPLDKALRIFKQILKAIVYAHSQSVVHRDLKPENIFLNEDGDVKVGDWGLSTQWTTFKKKHRGVGSLHYVAREVLLQQQYSGPEADIYGLGTVLYSMLIGKAPFTANTASGVYRKIKKGRWWESWEELSSLPTAVIRLLAGLLESNPLKRLTTLDIRKQIKQIEKLQAAGKLLPPTSIDELLDEEGLPPTFTTHLLALRNDNNSKRKRKRSAANLGQAMMSRLRPILEE